MAAIDFILWVWAGLAVVHWAVIAWLSLKGRDLVPPLPGAPESGTGEEASWLPRVHVLVPARNEERDVGACLRSILALDWPDLRVVLVDDGSTDGTAAVARSLAAEDPRLEVIEAGPLPEGWVGKPHALHRGWRHVRPEEGSLLLFTDADILFAPEVLGDAVAAMRREGADLVSLLPSMINRGFWEHVLQPAVAHLVALAGIAGRLARPERQIRLGAGAFLLVRAEAYRRAGGHRGVRKQIIEDIALATNVHHRGGETEVFMAHERLRVRMYRGLREIWMGWAKNMFAGHRDRISWALVTLLSLLAFSVLPPVLAAVLLGTGQGLLGGIFLAVAGFAFVYRGVGNLMMGEGFWWAAFHPLAAGVIASILVQSLWQRRFGAGAAWRGRRYPEG